MIFRKSKICIKCQHIHPHLQQLIQPLAVGSFEPSIYIKLKAAVYRYAKIDKPEDESDSVTKKLFSSRYPEN